MKLEAVSGIWSRYISAENEPRLVSKVAIGFDAAADEAAKSAKKRAFWRSAIGTAARRRGAARRGGSARRRVGVRQGGREAGYHLKSGLSQRDRSTGGFVRVYTQRKPGKFFSTGGAFAVYLINGPHSADVACLYWDWPQVPLNLLAPKQRRQ